MDGLNVVQLTSGFRDRMTKLALFDPLFELRSKRKSDRNQKPIDMMELGLLTLLYFFEQKLLRNSKAGVRDLAEFLYEQTRDVYDLPHEEVVELARQIIQTFRPASGKKRDFTFFNWEYHETEQVYTSIIKAHAFDLKTNTQYYTLDEDGLELVFATKEFYMEFQLSIHQLVLRKQLEKGEFDGALRQINEMRVDVESLQDRMQKLEHEIKRNTVSEETFARYKSLLEDIYLRLYRENEEFEELRQFVRDVKDRIHAETSRNKEQRPYELILRIANELEIVHGEHTVLFRQSMELKAQALTAAKESLYYTGLNSFNFEQDVASLIFGSPLPLESMKGIVAPFLLVEQPKQWSLLTVWAEQNIQEESSGATGDNRFMDYDGEQASDAYTEGRKEDFLQYMEWLLRLLEGEGHTKLSDMAEVIREVGQGQLLVRRSFYDFWLILHQRSPVRTERTEIEDSDLARNQWLENVLGLLGNRTLIVEEAKELVKVNERFTIQNMVASWKEDEDGTR
ncbi:replicative DNA helicase [Paenibacillus tianjinensis]|uniref:Replicative DNA helicase n=1 Tax=Paenibacillus tianjinensis TaxID=2810347 RepID=A0ABX7LCE6_9BACL|nr:replicative DNA helicase [Paenibacillus tianjinensis]QSF45606.1 replicative DNA helicase [Paenibacillus tianjinensis]